MVHFAAQVACTRISWVVSLDSLAHVLVSLLAGLVIMNLLFHLDVAQFHSGGRQNS